MATALSARARWAALQQELGRQMAQRLFDSLIGQPMARAPVRRARRSWSLALAQGLAVLVHAVGLAAVGVGLWLVWRWDNAFLVLLGISLLLLAVVSRPRRPPPPDHLLSPADYPVLHRLAERLARAIGAPLVDGLAVSADFNANYRSAGWRGRRYVELGAPLTAVLAPDERVALLAHELAHGANGDPLRGQWLHGAIDAIVAWATALRPLSVGHAGDGMPLGPVVSLIALPVELALVALSELLLACARGLWLLVLRESQRAEYLADLLAAQAAGSAPMQRMLEALALQDEVQARLRRHALTQPDAPIGTSLREALLAVAAPQRALALAASRERLAQVDTTHPPTALRIEMIAAHPEQTALPLLDAAETEALAAEFDRLLASQQRELVNRQLEAIHG